MFRIFVPLTKVDQTQRLIYGTAALEEVDTSKEIMDYAGSKPRFQKWSDGLRKATQDAGIGLSLGNVRAMHGKVAAGKLTEIDFNDEAMSIDVCAKIVDDAEWTKVQEGVYTGFSVGGGYAKRWPDPSRPGITRYIAAPVEISIVDNPCMPGATFAMTKIGGATEIVPFKPPMPINVWQAGENGPTFKFKAEAAEELRKIISGERDHIKMAKGMWQVSDLAQLLARLDGLRADVAWEQDAEGDTGSQLPDRLRQAVQTLSDILRAMVDEETGEMLADSVAGKSAEDDLGKAGARHSKTDKERLQGIHDNSVAMGADCASAKSAAGDLQKGANMTKDETDALVKSVTDELNKSNGDALTKALKPVSDSLEKITASIGASDTALAKLATDTGASLAKAAEATAAVAKSVGEIDDRLKKIEALPAATKGVIKLVPLDKSVDGALGADGNIDEAALAAALAKMSPAQQTLLLTKAALRNPTIIGGPQPAAS